MTRVAGIAVNETSGQPLPGRLIYARLLPPDVDITYIPDADTQDVTDADGNWELNLTPTVGSAAYYSIRVWQEHTYIVDVPDTTGIVDVTTIEIVQPDPDPGPTGPEKYLLTSQLGQPSGVASLDATGLLTLAQRPPGGGGDLGELAYAHTQDLPSTIWQITHNLPFIPAGIEVFDHLGEQHHPVITWPDALTVQLAFDTNVRGTARLS